MGREDGGVIQGMAEVRVSREGGGKGLRHLAARESNQHDNLLPATIDDH